MNEPLQTQPRQDQPLTEMVSRLGYVTIEDIRTWKQWPNNEVGHIANAYTLAKGLETLPYSVSHICPLPMPGPLLRAGGRIVRRLGGNRILLQVEPRVLRQQARSIERQLQEQPVDVLLSNITRPFSLLHTETPIVVWRDATFAGALSVHRDFKEVSQHSISLGHEMEKNALDRCRIAIFRSQWAASSAIHTYGIDPGKIRILPTGGNIQNIPTRESIIEFIASRPGDQCELLFIAVDWKGKGGEVVTRITQQLESARIPFRLTIAGTKRLPQIELPDNTRFLDFIDFQTGPGWRQYESLLARSHFLLFPSRVDTYGNVLPEANAFGVPCLASDNAGIPSIIDPGKNGFLFPMDTEHEARDYCDCIKEYMENYTRYQELALSSYDEYTRRLSWDCSLPELGRILQEATHAP